MESLLLKVSGRKRCNKNLRFQREILLQNTKDTEDDHKIDSMSGAVVGTADQKSLLCMLTGEVVGLDVEQLVC